MPILIVICLTVSMCYKNNSTQKLALMADYKRLGFGVFGGLFLFVPLPAHKKDKHNLTYDRELLDDRLQRA